MSAQQARDIIERELGGAKLDEIFSWIDLQEPLGSATIAQVYNVDCCKLQALNELLTASRYKLSELQFLSMIRLPGSNQFPDLPAQLQ